MLLPCRSISTLHTLCKQNKRLANLGDVFCSLKLLAEQGNMLPDCIDKLSVLHQLHHVIEASASGDACDTLVVKHREQRQSSRKDRLG